MLSRSVLLELLSLGVATYVIAHRLQSYLCTEREREPPMARTTTSRNHHSALHRTSTCDAAEASTPGRCDVGSLPFLSRGLKESSQKS